ncbi:MAG: AAA family ATPase [Planctomycetia bacterium]|nr:AAA family ATPase [Planctomycetia bacterium]
MKAMNVAAPDYLIYPWLRAGQSAIISAQAGIGKTFLALSIAKILTTGGTLFDERWSSPNAQKTLFLDGEMSLTDMLQRAEKFGLTAENNDFFLYNPDVEADGLPANLFRPDHQAALLEEVEHKAIKCVIMDNVSSLYLSDKPNNQEAWLPMQSVILNLRRMGVAVVLIDHQSKGADGSPRGLSVKLDVLHTAIALRRPDNYSPEDGCRFEIHFKKARGFFGERAAPFEVRLRGGEWETSEIQTATSPGRPRSTKQQEVFSMFHEGKSPADVLGLLDLPKASVYRWFSEWQKQSPSTEEGNPLEKQEE